MASINKRKNKSQTVWRIRFRANGKIYKPKIATGNKLDAKIRDKYINLFNDLESHLQANEAPSPKLIRDINSLDDEFKKRLERLDPPVIEIWTTPTLRDFLDAFIETKSELTEHTIYKMENTSRLFCEYFGSDVKINRITSGDVQDYLEWRKQTHNKKHAKPIAKATLSAEIKHGKQFFKYAVKKRYIEDNPFEEFVVGTQANEERRVVIPADKLEKVLESTNRLPLKTLIAIVRWTGCRIEEGVLLKWENILWDDKRIDIPSPKTAHLGKSRRIIPLDERLEPYLSDAFEAAEVGAVYVVEDIAGLPKKNRPWHKRQTKNFRTHFERLIERAGVDPWPKPWQNLRVTREHEMMYLEGHPKHCVVKWLGHAGKTYSEHYDAGIQESDFSNYHSRVTGPQKGQQGRASARTSDDLKEQQKKKPEFQAGAAVCSQPESGLAPLA